MQVDKDLRVMLIKQSAPAPRVVGVRVWPRAIPQFNVGHLDQLEKAKAALDQAGWDNFLLGGNYVSGESSNVCTMIFKRCWAHQGTCHIPPTYISFRISFATVCNAH
jgi:protoporphyrinogen oxidase